MQTLISRIVNNPALLGWIALIALVIGLALGIGGAWYIQGLRLTAVKSEYSTFVAKVEAEGKVAKERAESQAAEDKLRKESSDHVYQTTIDYLRADNQRLRNDRARGSYVPAAPATAQRPDLACFDRTELEQALRQFDKEVSGIVDEGSEATITLDAARSWAQGLKR